MTGVCFNHSYREKMPWFLLVYTASLPESYYHLKSRNRITVQSFTDCSSSLRPSARSLFLSIRM